MTNSSMGILSGTTKSAVGGTDPQPINIGTSMTTRVIFINLSKNNVFIVCLCSVFSRRTIASEENLPNKGLWEEEIPLFVNNTLLGGKRIPLITTVKRLGRKTFYNIHNPPILIAVATTIQ